MKTLKALTRPPDDTALAKAIGSRIRQARKGARMTQEQLSGDRYTKAYISALENGLVKPSMAALNYLADRLGLPPTYFLTDPVPLWSRLEADLALASGRWGDALDAFDVLLAATTDRLGRAELQRARAEALSRLDRGLEAITAATEATEVFAAAGRIEDAVWANYWLAFGHYLAENSAASRSILLQTLERLRAGLRIDPDFQVRVLVALANIDSRDGEYKSALAYLEEARTAAADLDGRRRATLMFGMAISYRETGDYEAAIKTGTIALGLFREAEAELETALMENDLALAYSNVGNLARAAELATSAQHRGDRLKDDRLLSHVIDTQARIALALGDSGLASTLAEQAIELAERSNNRKALLDALLTLARSQIQAGDRKRGMATFERAARESRAGAPRALLRETLSAYADALAEGGEHQRAYALTREALDASRT